ncbi:hypothetical protein SAMN04489712_12210 [Thermomonospora echinospora]|uniref:Uncharacterized protein n=1 Tax=Thermomonospora echinospora TaxID=1992 RepID=A0A1H6DUP5_9ACTN|nr:hypothetical protein [Thermomonospora echinospora]SEG88473.1 hypothetical protein SAMN04489712_12210 [Thermomonospora echinospora]
MTTHDEDERSGEPDVQLAAELIERAGAEGVSLENITVTPWTALAN